MGCLRRAADASYQALTPSLVSNNVPSFYYKYFPVLSNALIYSPTLIATSFGSIRMLFCSKKAAISLVPASLAFLFFRGILGFSRWIFYKLVNSSAYVTTSISLQWATPATMNLGSTILRRFRLSLTPSSI